LLPHQLKYENHLDIENIPIMPKFRICDRLISFDYPASLSECAERILSCSAKIKILERTGQKEAAILADCELAMLHEWQNSSYLLTMMSVRNSQEVSESKLKEEGGLVRHLQSILLRLHKKGLDIGEEAKVVCQYAREWLASKGCQDIPPEYLIPDKFKVEDCDSAVHESKLVMDTINGKTSLTQLGKALQDKLNQDKLNQKKNTTPNSHLEENLSKQIELFTKSIQNINQQLHELESIKIEAITKKISNIESVCENQDKKNDEKLSVIKNEFTNLQNKINKLDNIPVDKVEPTLAIEQGQESISDSIIDIHSLNKTESEKSHLNKLLKKYQDEINILSKSRKDRLSKLEKKVESLSGFAEVERNIRMSQHKTTSNNIKILKEACQFVTQTLEDKNKTQQIEILLSSVGFFNNSHIGNNPAPSKSVFVTELNLFN
jgi:vacuolar-type H+-ATPase subunit I/STV1